MKFTIDKKLRKPHSALRNLAQCVDSHSTELLQYVQDTRLYTLALQLFKDKPEMLVVYFLLDTLPFSQSEGVMFLSSVTRACYIPLISSVHDLHSMIQFTCFLSRSPTHSVIQLTYFLSRSPTYSVIQVICFPSTCPTTRYNLLVPLRRRRIVHSDGLNFFTLDRIICVW